MAAALFGLVLLSSLIRLVYSQSPAQLTFSSNPVYSGEPVMLTCDYGSGFFLNSVMLEASNGALRKGSLLCTPHPRPFVNTTGVLNGTSFTGCPYFVSGVTSVNVTLTADPSLELNYTCTVKGNDGSNFYSVTSGPTFLQVRRLCPLPPKLQHSLFVFNDTDVATVTCESGNGKPAALVSITVSNSSGATLSMNGTNSASLVLLSSPDWHNATATCFVTNHNCSNMTVTSGMLINHIKVVKLPDVFRTNEKSNATLDCSAYVTGYPGILYYWTAQLSNNVTESSRVGGPSFTVQQGQFGVFNCTATINVTAKSVVIVFVVSNTMPTTAVQLPLTSPPPFWIIGLVAGLLVITVVAVVLGVLCKRGHFSKGKKKPDVEPSGTDQRSDNGSNRGRLLIAAKGVVSNLKHKVLSNITLLEYADRTCTLDDILDQVKQAISLSSPPVFESVALLLRRSRIGLILSETDQAVLTSESWTGAQGKKQRVFFTRLAKMSLDKRARRNRIDLLNYDSKDAESLCLAMTRLLKIPVTVSKDRFGMDKSAHRDDKEPYCVGEDYFSGASLSQIVYAEVELNNSHASSPLRKDDNVVVYSELVRKS